MKEISKIAISLRNGKPVKQSRGAGGLPITRIETIASGSINPFKVGFAGLRESDCSAWLLDIGDILISHINSTKHLGKCAIYEGSPPSLVHGMNLLGLRVDASIASPRYVYRMLASPDFRRQLPRITKNSVNQSSFNISSFKKLRIPLPPLSEQKRIAKILDAADALRAKRRESLALLDELLRSAFLDMFGDPVTNPKGWPVHPLDRLASVQTGSTPPSKLDGMFDGAIPFITPKDLKDTWVQPSRTVTEAGAAKSRTVERDATLVCCIGAIGKMGKATTRSAFNQQINSVSWGDQVDGVYGLEALKFLKTKISERGSSTTLPILKKSLFQKVTIPVPPLDAQRRFAKFVSALEDQRVAQSRHLAELDNLFASLQSRAFRGEL